MLVSREKLSKKARKEEDRKKREFWTMNPVTRVKESKKIYNRKQRWELMQE